MRPTPAAGVLLAALGVATACGGPRNPHVLTFAGSAVGAEAAAIRRQLDRFHAAHPSMRVELRATPDAADQRHQLYVQWLNAHAADPDVLQLDVVWTPEFAAAGWIASLDGFQPPAGDFFPQAIAASRWRGVLYALPWFLDAGTLYWRTDLMRTPPADFDALDRMAARAQREHGLPFGFVWEGARYEGLVTVFLEYLSAYGGTMIDASGRVAVDSDAAVAALTRMHDAGLCIAVDRDPRLAAGPMQVGVRPHDVLLTAQAEADAVGRVDVVEPLGATAVLHVGLNEVHPAVRVVVPADRIPRLGELVGLRARRDRLHVFDAAGVAR